MCSFCRLWLVALIQFTQETLIESPAAPFLEHLDQETL
jgi:hypothetical protein